MSKTAREVLESVDMEKVIMEASIDQLNMIIKAKDQQLAQLADALLHAKECPCFGVMPEDCAACIDIDKAIAAIKGEGNE